jgi:hypothetical protein
MIHQQMRIAEQSPSEDMCVPMTEPGDIARMESHVALARKRGLERLTFVIEGQGAAWIASAVREVARFRRQGLPFVELGAKTQIVDEEGRLDFDPRGEGVDRLYVSMDRLPLNGECLSALALREALEEGRLSALEILRQTGDVLLKAIDRNPGVILSDPLAILRATGIPDEWLGDDTLSALALRTRDASSSLLVDEWQRAPRVRAVRAFAEAGATIVFGSGARDSIGIGVYDYVRRVLGEVPSAAIDCDRMLAPVG